MAICSEITEKQCVIERHAYSTAKIRFVQNCAAISAVAEFLLDLPAHQLSCAVILTNVMFNRAVKMYMMMMMM